MGRFADSNADGHTNGDTNCYANRDADSNADGHTYNDAYGCTDKLAYRDADRHAGNYTYRDTCNDTYGNIDRDICTGEICFRRIECFWWKECRSGQQRGERSQDR